MGVFVCLTCMHSSTTGWNESIFGGYTVGVCPGRFENVFVLFLTKNNGDHGRVPILQVDVHRI